MPPSFLSAQRETDPTLWKQDLISASSIILHNALKSMSPVKMFFFSSSKGSLVEQKHSQHFSKRCTALGFDPLSYKGTNNFGSEKSCPTMTTHLGSRKE